MMTPSEGFELLPEMREAAPVDVQGVLDTLDILLMDADRKEHSADAYNPLDGQFIGDTPFDVSDILQRMFNDMAKRHRLTPEQLSNKLNGDRLHELLPIGGLEKFSFRRFGEAEHRQLAMIIRWRSVDDFVVNYVLERPNGIKLVFDEAGPRTANLSECNKLKSQLSSTYVI